LINISYIFFIDRFCEKPVRAAKRRKLLLEAGLSRARIVDGPGLYANAESLQGLIAIDPEVRTIITAVQLDAPDRKPFQLSQAEYRDGSMLNYKLKKLGSQSAARHVSARFMAAAPSV
jgi:hypothetical protein